MFGRWGSRVGAAMVSLVLAACGGGGGGDGGVRVSADKSKVNLLGLNGHMILGDTIAFTLENGSGTYYAMAVSDSDAVEMAVVFPTDRRAIVNVSLGSMGAGRRISGQLSFVLCRDAVCKDEVWRRQIAYAATMYKIDTRPLTLTGHEGAREAPITLAIAPADTDGELVFESEVGFLAADHSAPDKVVLTPSGIGLSAGQTYSGSVAINTIRNGVETHTAGEIQASFTVGNGIVAPAVAALDLVAGSTADSLRGEAAVAFAGTQAPAWTASSDSSWLVLDTTSGSGAGTLAFHVDTTRTAALANWKDQVAQVTLAAPGLSPVIVPVTLRKRLPDIAMVTPSGILSGRATQVRVTGRGLTGLDAAAFSVNGSAPSAVTIESDSAATLSLPALAAGAQRVAVTSALGDSGATALLGVRDPATLAAARVASTGIKRAAVFDASRNAVFATVWGDNALVRYRLVGGQWQAQATAVAQVGSLALAPDGRTVYVASGSRLLAIDPDTLETRKSVAAPFALDGGFLYGHPIAQTHDLRLWFGGDQWDGAVAFDQGSGRFEPAVTWGEHGGSIYSPELYAPNDGSALLLQSNGISPEPPMVWYSAATGRAKSLDDAPRGQSQVVHFSQDGRLLLLGGRELYRSRDFALLGNADVDESAGHAWESLLSPDGRRVYAVVARNGETVMDHVEVFDTTRTAAGTANFVKLGEIALPDKAVGCDLGQDSYCDARGRWIIDPTGTVLFWLGDAQLVVLPVPSSLSGIAANGAPQGQLLRKAERASR